VAANVSASDVAAVWGDQMHAALNARSFAYHLEKMQRDVGLGMFRTMSALPGKRTFSRAVIGMFLKWLRAVLALLFRY
jgi:hypothetical protein